MDGWVEEIQAARGGVGAAVRRGEGAMAGRMLAGMGMQGEGWKVGEQAAKRWFPLPWRVALSDIQGVQAAKRWFHHQTWFRPRTQNLKKEIKETLKKTSAKII